ncbi:isoaspartyl peptidase/L-asparaginase [Rhizobium laguerreae]|uniref:isoaspartyl peptidase/L-asparaginase n=1 Tax=Rhizobium laguerreae TaxID=1076926 RepID=UPI001FE46492|nr:isoaspartyl peptidase/L-asparaginase [Rhizobium laguerreae]
MWSIILQGGAKTIEDKDAAANRSGCRKALEAGASILASGGTSIDAAEAAVRVLEDDPTFNAGYGSVQNEDGEVECCAAMMEGERFNVVRSRRRKAYIIRSRQRKLCCSTSPS